MTDTNRSKTWPVYTLTGQSLSGFLESSPLRINILPPSLSVGIAQMVFFRSLKFVHRFRRRDGLVALRADRIDRGVMISPSGETNKARH